MAEVRVVEEISASADAVWELVRDFGGVMKWSSAIESCEVQGEGIGAVRTLALPGGAAIRERLERFEDEGRSFSYSILDGPLPVDDYLATLVVRAKGADRCEVDWASSFAPKGLAEEQVLGIIRGVYEGGIREIKKNLEK